MEPTCHERRGEQVFLWGEWHRRARDERAAAHPERGLWHSASLTLDPGGLVMIKASWEFEPDFREGSRMTRAELDADLMRYPRSPRWREPWMDDLK